MRNSVKFGLVWHGLVWFELSTRVLWLLHEVLWGIHRVPWGFHEVFPALPCSALMLLRQSVSEWVSHEPRYRAAIAAKKYAKNENFSFFSYYYNMYTPIYNYAWSFSCGFKSCNSPLKCIAWICHNEFQTFFISLKE